MSGTEGRHRPAETLRGQAKTLQLFYRALCGRDATLVPYAHDGDLHQHPDTDVSVRLPSHVHPPAGLAARDWYRVAVAHRALHYELGTFDVHAPVGGRLDRFIASFSRPALAMEVFVAIEDLRIDSHAKLALPGLRRAIELVQAQELSRRPDPGDLPPRAAAAEALVRISLDAPSVTVPAEAVAVVRDLARIAAPVRERGCPADRVALATMWAYSILARLPNIGRWEGPPVQVALVTDAPAATDYGEPVGDPSVPEVRLDGDDVLDVRFHPVRYRDVPGPRYLGIRSLGMPMREAILRITASDDTAAADTDLMIRAQQAESGLVDVTDTRPTPPPEPLPHDHGPDLDSHHEPTEGAVTSGAPDEFVYPEWDTMAGVLRPRWCLVTQVRPRAEHSTNSIALFLQRESRLRLDLTQQLLQLRDEGLVRLGRMPDGDDLDFDACVEAVSDLRARHSPGDRVHVAWRRSRRDVAVALLVDMSSSTAERVGSPAPGTPPTRILDLEVRAVALLCCALEEIGDSYGVYGFSGTGRRDVRVSVVKSLAEPWSARSLQRLSGLRPDHATRMGAAVRHVTRALAEHEAATKILLLVSDGRPFDVDYGQQYGDEAVTEYAIADTAASLREARAHGIRPHLVTVDPGGQEYVGSMFGPSEFQVIDDPHQLPQALASLYPRWRRSAMPRPQKG